MKHHDTNPGSHSRLLCRRSSAAIRSRSSAAGPIRIFVSPISLQCGLRPSAKCRRRGSACRRICGRRGSIPARLDRVADRSMAENLEALQRGPDRGRAAFRARSSKRPWPRKSVTSGTRRARAAAPPTRLLSRRETGSFADAEPLLRMVRAIYRTQQWIHTQSAQEIAAAIALVLPGARSRRAGRALARYQSQPVWGRDPVLPEDGFDRLRRGLVSSGFIRQPVAICGVRRQSFRPCRSLTE